MVTRRSLVGNLHHATDLLCFLLGLGALVRVGFYPGVCSNAGGVSFPTTGTIVATFSNMP